MSHTFIRCGAMSALLPLAVVVGAAIGCGPSGPATYSVTGKVDLSGGSADVLTGTVIEASLASDPQVRAYGEVGPDGSFALETLHEGAMRQGAFEGTYLARLVLPDDDAEVRKRTAAAIHPKYLQFEASGLTIDVPAAATVVTLPITRR